MTRLSILFLSLFACLAVGSGFVACGEDIPHLCSGPNCANASNCPAERPEEGATCTSQQQGDCHYCVGGSTTAQGFDCDGSTWTLHATEECGRHDSVPQ